MIGWGDKAMIGWGDKGDGVRPGRQSARSKLERQTSSMKVRRRCQQKSLRWTNFVYSWRVPRIRVPPTEPKKEPTERQPFIEVEQSQRSFYLTKLRARHLTNISYASVRNQSDEPGAVQRILNTRRIKDLQQYALERGEYPTSVVLNWVSKEHPLKPERDVLSIPNVTRCAQVIDGQHRIEGLRVAIAEDARVGDIEIPTSIYLHLDTAGCADIFLSINTEQRPVPPSLVQDLYGVTGQHQGDAATMRARDIAKLLNEEEEGPYAGLIKFPGMPRMRGGVALSTVVSALKPLVEEKGILERSGVTELSIQYNVIRNFFLALQEKYGSDWESVRENAFLFAAGFTGAIDFLGRNLVPECEKREHDFTKEFMASSLSINKKSLIKPSDTSGLSGTAAAARVRDLLVKQFLLKSATPVRIKT